MKTRTFVLTKNEQRVVILAMLALLAGAFAKFARNAPPGASPNHSNPAQATATPLNSPKQEVQPDAGTED